MSPADELLKILDDELDTVKLAEERKQKVYHSLLKLSELIGGEYGDRVIYELLQNAHDAQSEAGKVAIRLVVDSASVGELLIANGGMGFTYENLQAVRNIAASTKEIGEGIGNKGVGFRSVEALTDDAHVYSCLGKGKPRDRFDGYCFRFATPNEVRDRLLNSGRTELADAVAAAIPRYLAAVPADEQPDAVTAFAKQGFATVVRLPLRSIEAVQLAIRQVQELVASAAPVLLFLDRIARLDVKIEGVAGVETDVRMTRSVQDLGISVPDQPHQSIAMVTLGPDKRQWLIARRMLPRDTVVEAVAKSVPQESGLKSWLKWRGDAVVSVALPLDGSGLVSGRYYNFLPMSAEAQAPTFAHIDAPFFTNISRKQMRADLHLNSLLLNAVAELCATTALALVRAETEIPTRCVVDLVAWKVTEKTRLEAAFRTIGSTLVDAEVWPTTAKRWGNFRHVRSWPAGEFRVFTAARATRAGVEVLLNPKLPPNRLVAIEALAQSILMDGCKVAPSQLAFWAQAVASSLSKTRYEDWEFFYRDLALAFGNGGSLGKLTGFPILLDREGIIQCAGEDVYVRSDGSRRKKPEGSPLPPESIARKLRILSDEIKIPPEISALFERAKLWRRFDAIEVLERLPTLFGSKPAPARREAALKWAFEVWRSDPQGAKKALSSADLHVPTRSGWKPANQAAFSETWTDCGADLDAFLAEARRLCEDCAAAAENMLTDVLEWSVVDRRSQSEWVRFLTDAGVVDGLVAVSVELPEGPISGGNWMWRLNPILGDDWHRLASRQLAHPQTNYWRQGEASKLPGQSIASELSLEARKRFSVLIIRHLEVFGETHLWFRLARTDRDDRYQDPQQFRTPLSIFLTEAEWVPIETGEGLQFSSIANAWWMSDRRVDPKFVPRISEEVSQFLSKRSDGALKVLSERPFGLRRWRDKLTAQDRLNVLAEVCSELAMQDRAPFLGHYVNAWKDLLETGRQLSSGGSLVVRRPDGFKRLEPSASKPVVYVADGASIDLAKLLIDSGQAVLAINDDVDAHKVIEVIEQTGGFDVRSAENAEIQLLIDGERFGPRPSDPLLVDVLPWLKEALLLGHELGARSLEKGARVGAVIEKLQRLRLRLASEITLQSGDGEGRALARHLHRDERWPTLIVRAPFVPAQLVSCATLITDFLNQNLRTFELLLVKLAYRFPSGIDLSTIQPSDRDYAEALDKDLFEVRDHLETYRHDDAEKIQLVLPVLAYFLGVEVAQAQCGLLADTTRDSWRVSLETLLQPGQAEKLLAALDETDDLGILRRELGLDYAAFNRALVELGRPPLSNEVELRRLFEVWKIELREALRERLRRQFWHRLGQNGALEEYASARDLDFVTFDPSWVETQETLTREMVSVHAQSTMQARFGDDVEVDLPPLDPLRTNNRKTVAKFAERAKPVLVLVAEDTISAEWREGPRSVADALDLKGLLDFEPIQSDADVLATLARGGLWPKGVSLSIELADQGLTDNDLKREADREKEQRAEESRRLNRVEFMGVAFDASEPEFADAFASLLSEEFDKCDWRSRSSLRPVSLAPQPEVDPSSRSGGASGKKIARPPKRAPEAVRSAIGLAGELLAFRFLQAKHPRHFTERSWVSENRTSLFPEPGNITEGCDFRIQTTETEWLYEVKATPGDGFEFELSDNEYRTAVAAAEVKSQEFRILFVQHVLDPQRCRVLELPNPAGRQTSGLFRIVGRSSVRMRFELD